MKKASAIIIATVMCIGISASASPVGAAVKTTGAVVKKVLPKSGGQVAVRGVASGGAALATVSAERAASRAVAKGTNRAVAHAAGKETGETVLKHVTPGKILAVGGGAALVTASHEIADGIQAMGIGVGEAVKDNPDLARDVAAMTMAPLRWLWITGGSVVALLLLWFCWPWIALARNWSRLRALRRSEEKVRRENAAKSAADATAPAEASPVEAPSSGMRSGKVGLFVVFSVAAFVLLTVVGIGGLSFFKDDGGAEHSTESPVTSSVECREKAAKRERMARILNELNAEYRKRIDRIHANFTNRVEEVAREEFGDVRDMVPSVADKFSAFSRCKDLFQDAVIDKIRGGDLVGQSIKRDLEKEYYRGLYGARDKVFACVRDFRDDLVAAEKVYRLSVEMQMIEEPFADEAEYNEFLLKCANLIESDKGKLRDAQNIAALSVALEVILIRQTVSVIGKVIGKAVARQAGAILGGATATLADGPLPVCDIIAGIAVLGCTAWTAYDVWQATSGVPRELRKTLTDVVNDCEAKCIKEMLALGQELYEGHVEAFSGAQGAVEATKTATKNDLENDNGSIKKEEQSCN